MKQYVSIWSLIGLLGLGLATTQSLAQAQGGGAPAPAPPAGGQAGGGGRANAPPPFDTTKTMKLDIVEAKGRYRVSEQLAGLNFLSDAVGGTDAITGSLVIAPDGSIGPGSKLTVDLKSLKSDQELRDNYLRNRVFEVEKFPTLEFVAKRAPGVPTPLPGTPQQQANGFQLIGDMTLHGVTKEVTWNTLITVRGAAIAGRAMTTITFQDFNLMKPAVPFLLSSDDKIQLEVEFRCNRTAL